MMILVCAAGESAGAAGAAGVRGGRGRGGGVDAAAAQALHHHADVPAARAAARDDKTVPDAVAHQEHQVAGHRGRCNPLPRHYKAPQAHRHRLRPPSRSVLIFFFLPLNKILIYGRAASVFFLCEFFGTPIYC
jgi:hypothetical protein